MYTNPHNLDSPGDTAARWSRASLWFLEVFRAITIIAMSAAGGAVGGGMGAGGAEALGVTVGCLTGYVIGGVVGRGALRTVEAIEDHTGRVPAHELIAGGVGATLGVLIGAAVSAPVFFVAPVKVALPLLAGIAWVAAWAGMRICVDRSDALFAAAGLSTRPLVRAETWQPSQGVIVDSSAILDGPLRLLVDAGILDDPLLIPVFVLDEVHGLADADGHRGRLARRGLESLEGLRGRGHRIEILDDELPDIASVDAKVIALARRLRLRVLTTDERLAANAAVQGVAVTNLRRLADSFAPDHVGGETVDVELVRPGKEPGQGVGYLDDGSMIVVAGGHGRIGVGPTRCVITSVVPTARGRMLFARLDHT